MLVTVKPKLSVRHPGIVYASIYNGEELLVNATLDYCLGACAQRGYQIENAQEVLLWMYNNVEFQGITTA